MKFKALLIIVVVVFLAQVTGSILFFTFRNEPKQNTVIINDILNNCVNNWGDLDSSSTEFEYDYTVIDNSGKLLFASNKNLSQNENEAIKNRDTILDIKIGNEVVGKLLINNNYQNVMNERYASILVFNIVTLFLMLMLLVGYLIYINNRVVKPFVKLKQFAQSVASGNLENELDMDKQNIFGAFTESFDIMRSELKRSKDAEEKAQTSKKQLIANLSHDIKTPIASIKAMAEVGELKAKEKDKNTFSAIIKKADQVNALVSNLFSSTLEEMSQLSISINDFSSVVLEEIIGISDYLNKSKMTLIPEMILSFDRQRLQQVVDNIISNSYKYAASDINVNFTVKDNFLCVTFTDYGGCEEKGDKLLQKYYRGENAKGKEGAGLGLYISKYLMTAMGGDLSAQSYCDKFIVEICIKIS